MKQPIQNYRMLQKPQENSQKNEIRVKANARQFIYAAYAGKLLFEKNYERVFMLATGAATAKVIQSVEHIRKRVKGLCVCYEIESTEFVDEYEPLIEGLDHVQVKRLVPTLKAFLFLNKDDELKNRPGFMAPLPENQLLDEEKFKAEIEEHFKKDRHGEEDGARGEFKRGRQGDGRRGDFRGQYRGDGEGRREGDRPRGGRGPRNFDREDRAPREHREPREPREHREPREPREHREPREPRGDREYRGDRDNRGPRPERGPRQDRPDRPDRPPRENRFDGEDRRGGSFRGGDNFRGGDRPPRGPRRGDTRQ